MKEKVQQGCAKACRLWCSGDGGAFASLLTWRTEEEEQEAGVGLWVGLALAMPPWFHIA